MVDTSISYQDVKDAYRDYMKQRGRLHIDDSGYEVSGYWTENARIKGTLEFRAAELAANRIISLYVQEVAWEIEAELRRHADELNGMPGWYKRTGNALLRIARDVAGDMRDIELDYVGESAGMVGVQVRVIGADAPSWMDSYASATPPYELCDESDVPSGRERTECSVIAYPDPLPEMRPKPDVTAAKVRRECARMDEVRTAAEQMEERCKDELAEVARRYAAMFDALVAENRAATGIRWDAANMGGVRFGEWYVSASTADGEPEAHVIDRL